MIVRHLLCAVDFSPASERAWEEALRIATLNNSVVTLLHAVPPHETFNRHAGERRRRMERWCEKARGLGVDARIELQHGNPVRVVLLHAAAKQVDLVVLGAGSRRGLARLKRTSSAEAIVRAAACPCLVVPQASSAGDGPVVCAVALAPSARRTVRAALSAAVILTDTMGVTLLHAVEGLPPAASPRYGWRLPDPEFRQAEYGAARHRLDALVPPAPRIAGSATTRVVPGPAADVILSVAAESGARLIVVGRTERGALARWLERSTDARVARDAPCPVLVVPPQDLLPSARLRRAA